MARLRTFLPREQAQPPLFVGVDLGGTNIKTGLLDDLGRVLAYERFPTEVAKGPEDACRRICEGVRRLIAKTGVNAGDVVRVGLGSPGTMDIPAGLLLAPPNLPGWENFP